MCVSGVGVVQRLYPVRVWACVRVWCGGGPETVPREGKRIWTISKRTLSYGRSEGPNS